MAKNHEHRKESLRKRRAKVKKLLEQSSSDEDKQHEGELMPAQIFFGGQKDLERVSEHELQQAKIVYKENGKVHPEEEELDITGMAVPRGKESDVDAELDSLYDIGLNFKEKLKRKDQKQQKFNNYIECMQANELDQSKIRDRNYEDIKRQTHAILTKAGVQ